MKEVVVESGRKNDNLLKPQMGTETLNLNAISKVPVIFGEKDILKTLQLSCPGVAELCTLLHQVDIPQK